MADTPAHTRFDDYNTSSNDAVNASVSFSGLKVDFFTKVKAQYDRRYILSVPPLNPALMRVDRSLSRLPFGGQFYVAAS
jgi:hypothetical protein